ncbi:sensor histidine kinase [Sulfitobacter noctilucae]|uniref:sensor histidine kinase n=1 Tax=Sulfitobacter noctilucae TaxID=1342302 RepID=UPI000469C0AB|nr:PAS domain-containing sensor histidine kinase [Sulfitobacter noctilucae]
MPNNIHMLQEVAQAGIYAWDAAPFLQKVTDILPNIVYVYNHQTQSNEYSNHSIGAALGYSTGEVQAMGADMMPMLCHPDDLERVFAHFGHLQSLHDGEVLQLEYRVKHKQGSWVWLLSNDAVFERDRRGQVIRHIGVATDITLQKTAEESARFEHQRAVTINKELRAFSYSMSHDMKTPSNTLNLLLSELTASHGPSLDEDAMELLRMAHITLGQMGDLVDSLLKYTQVVDDDVVPEPVALGDIVHSILDTNADRIRASAARIAVSDMPTVLGDRAQLHTLLNQLIDNALKFYRTGSAPDVSISAVPEPDTNRIALTIRDHGIGIEPNKHEEIFTIFKRLNMETEYSGRGLGLAICQRIAANHDSHIAVASGPAQGTSFTIRLTQV